jgi:DNA-binding NarL/FixJ family response regulator
VAAGRTYIDPSVGRRLLTAPPADDLTPRERDVLRELALGHSNREIAAALDIGDETVKTHVGNLLAKLGVENRAQAIVQALKRGLVSLDDLE